MSCRGIISSTVEATAGLASRVYNWVTSPFRAEPEPKAEDQEDNEDTDAGAEEGSEDPPVPEDAEESKPEEAKPEAEEVSYTSHLLLYVELKSYVARRYYKSHYKRARGITLSPRMCQVAV